MLTLNKLIDYFAALTKFIILLTLSKSKKLVAFSNSTGYLGYLPLTLQYLCDLWDAMPMLVTSYFPPTFLLCMREQLLLSFLPHTPLCFFQRLPWGQQFNLSTTSCWSAKYSPGPTTCFNHTNPQWNYAGNLYLMVMASYNAWRMSLTRFELFSQ